VSVSNGGSLRSAGCSIGSSGNTSNNEALVTGPGTLWTDLGEIHVGGVGSANRLVLSNGALVLESASIVVGSDQASRNNRLVVDGGNLVATNAANRGLDVRHGTAIRLGKSDPGAVSGQVVTTTTDFVGANDLRRCALCEKGRNVLTKPQPASSKCVLDALRQIVA
jgi:T5SS/PEP-CTERM-associated repeat protein